MGNGNEMNDGWIEWNGGECPIKSEKTRGMIKKIDGEADGPNPLQLYRWDIMGGDYDIIAYRITENHEPTETAPDMSQNRVPWGLLTDEERGVIEAWVNSGGKVTSWWQGWSECEIAHVGPRNNVIYRTVAPPVITEEHHVITMLAGHLVRVAVTLQDGKPISGTVAL